MVTIEYCLEAGLLWWLSKLARRWIAEADKIVCVSRRQVQIISDLAPELEEKIEVVYNLLPTELVSKNLEKDLHDRPTFLYVGGSR